MDHATIARMVGGQSTPAKGRILITAEEKRKLLGFIGYGRLDAPVWFLGMEEAGGGEDKLLIRTRFNRVEDLYEAHKALGITRHHEGRRVLQPQWGRMSDLMLRLSGVSAPTTEDRRAYQALRLGRRDGETLLTELLPIPKPRLEIWDYPNVFPEYRSASEYYESVLPARLELLTRLIEDYRPAAIVAYGSSFRHHYDRLLDSGVSEIVDGFEVRKTQGTLLVMTPFLTSRTMNGRIQALAEIISHHIE